GTMTVTTGEATERFTDAALCVAVGEQMVGVPAAHRLPTEIDGRAAPAIRWRRTRSALRDRRASVMVGPLQGREEPRIPRDDLPGHMKGRFMNVQVHHLAPQDIGALRTRPYLWTSPGETLDPIAPQRIEVLPRPEVEAQLVARVR